MLLFALSSLLLLTGHDGSIFDQGQNMKNRAPKAPVELDQAQFILGQWDVIATDFQDGKPGPEEKGQAYFHWMNRGHAIMGRTRFGKEGGDSSASISFTVYNSNLKVWGTGIADTDRMAIRVLTGNFQEDQLVLVDSSRPNGGMIRRNSQLRIAKTKNGFVRTFHVSSDGGASFQLVRRESFHVHTESDGFFASQSKFGKAAEDRLAKANEFDFLIGRWEANHDMTFPNGQRARWKANATGVHILNGYGILEFNWFDTDPNLPDAATSLLRIFNPAMNRWESLYLTNRANALLYFGGVAEEGRVILTLFETDATAPRLSQFVFHSIKENAYSWFAQNSTDRGKSYTKTWTIDLKRLDGP